MLAILPLELPVVLRVARRPVEHQDLVRPQQVQDRRRPVRTGPVEAVDEGHAVSVQVHFQSAFCFERIVPSEHAGRGPIRDLRIRREERDPHAIGTLHVELVRAADDAGERDVYPRASGDALGFHRSQRVPLDASGLPPGDTWHTHPQGVRAAHPVHAPHEVLHFGGHLAREPLRGARPTAAAHSLTAPQPQLPASHRRGGDADDCRCQGSFQSERAHLPRLLDPLARFSVRVLGFIA